MPDQHPDSAEQRKISQLILHTHLLLVLLLASGACGHLPLAEPDRKAWLWQYVQVSLLGLRAQKAENASAGGEQRDNKAQLGSRIENSC